MKPFLHAAVLLVLSGCQYDPHAHSYTTVRPQSGDIVGEYELKQIYMDRYATGIREQIQKLPSIPTLRISPDGSFSASHFPYFSELRQGFEYRFEDFRSLEGRWEQASGGGISDGAGTVRERQGLRLSGLPQHLGWPGFTGVEKVDGLIFGFGDPDSGDAIIFHKK